jgi:hypothetical protein
LADSVFEFLGGDEMKTVAWVGVAYLALVGVATFYSGVSANSPTADSIAKLPSVGSLVGSSGTTAAALDVAGAAALWFFVLR